MDTHTISIFNMNMEKKAIKYAAGSSKRDIPMRKGKTQATKKYFRGSFRKEN